MSFLTTLSALACAQPEAPLAAPEAALTQSFRAQDAFRDLERDWSNATPSERPRLVPRFKDFLRLYPNDPKANLARLELAWILLTTGNTAHAKELLSQVGSPREGRVRDLKMVLLAGLELEGADAKRASARLTALRGRIIDPIERSIASELLVRGTLKAQATSEAIGYMLDFLVGAPLSQREAARAQVKSWLIALPPRALEVAFAKLSGVNENLTSTDRDRAKVLAWMLGVLREELTASALQDRDALLAQRLLERDRSGSSNEALADLASTGELPARIVGRTVGLLLELASAQSSQRSAKLAIGVGAALGLTSRQQPAQKVELITRAANDEGSLRAALSQLLSDGASILIAGVSAASAAAASEFAEAEQVPVMLVAGNAATPRPMSFWLGIDEPFIKAQLLEWAGKQAMAHTDRVEAFDPRCAPEAAAISGSSFPLLDWKKAGLQALLVDVLPGCVEMLRDELTQARQKPLFLLGVDSAHLYENLFPAATFKSALFPEQIAALASPAKDSSDAPELAAPLEGPAWFEALGHDAAILAQTALLNLPEVSANSADEVRRLHGLAAKALKVARSTELWTTTSQGFSYAQRVERSFSVVRAATPTPPRPALNVRPTPP